VQTKLFIVAGRRAAIRDLLAFAASSIQTACQQTKRAW
jgi:hypothetical protein